MSRLLDDAAWCRRQFSLIADNGVWTVPRSGLTFQRRGEALHLTQRSPKFPAPQDEAEQARWRRYQDEDLALITNRFALAGIAVWPETDRRADDE